jgi:hypothetical protein
MAWLSLKPACGSNGADAIRALPAVCFVAETEDFIGDEDKLPSRVIGKKPKPAALILGFDDENAERIGSLFSAWQPITHLDEVDQQESDVLVRGPA